MPPFCLPHSTNALPTASSVTVFQLAENQTLKTPATTFGSGSGAAAAGAEAGFASAGFGASAGLAAAADEGGLQAATRMALLKVPSMLRKSRRDHGRTLRCVSMHTTSTPGKRGYVAIVWITEVA